MNFLSAKHLPMPADADAAQRGLETWMQQAASASPPLSVMMSEVAVKPETKALLTAIFGGSPFLTNCLLREPQVLGQLLEHGPDAEMASLLADLRESVAEETDVARLMRTLRIAKRRVALLTALADISGQWPLESVTQALSQFAETAIQAALTTLLLRAHKAGDLVLPFPATPDRDCGVIVLGMGKLGAGELNYSSDIDLIILYDHEKLDYRGKRSLPECMIALTRELVRVMDERSADGYVFRTDLRLRPDPGSTPLAVSLVAAEAYYEGFGQNWERAAMIKARPMAGDIAAGFEFIKTLRPFIWRKSLDFAAIQDIHSIKRQINAYRGGRSIQVPGHNIKLGRGGIREIEFFIQTQQLIWGGREPPLRLAGTIAALRAFAEAGHVSGDAASDLEAAYHYLRRLEHRLQMVDDQQTQTMPSDPGRLEQIARFLGHADATEMARELTGHLIAVERHYGQLFESSPSLGAHGNLSFTGADNDPETVRTITEMGFDNAGAVCSTIKGWHHGRAQAMRSTRARELLTEITPALLSALAATAHPYEAFLRFDEFLRHLPAGVPVFSFFHANPSLLDLVGEIMGNAPALAQQLARHSNLLDGLLHADFFAPLPGATELSEDLALALAEAPDFQEALEVSRRWANERKFRVGVQTLRSAIDPIEASRSFSDIADAVLGCMGRLVETELVRANGAVPGGGWCLLALGKLGGREMAATSDLDMILIYDAASGADQSDGPRPLAIPTWYARLTQRLVTALTALTPEGVLYEVDLRLRPSGNKGPIATSLESFRRYHNESAWTWEHMALTRARVVAGDSGLAKQVRQVIAETLTRQRDSKTLVTDVASMRERMAKEHKAANHWQVKHLRGGLVDVEFIAQYLQLAHAHDHPSVLSTNTGEVLDRAAGLGLLSRPDHDVLKDAWRLWSAIQMVLRQTIAGEFDEKTAPRGLRDVLTRASGLADFRSLVDRTDDLAALVLEVFQRLVDEPARASGQASTSS